MIRKYESGSQKRNKMKKIEKMIQTQKGALDKFFKTSSSIENPSNELVNESQQPISEEEEIREHGTNELNVVGDQFENENETEQMSLNGLAILCIEKNMLEIIDFEEVIDDFASQNARRSRIFL
ncbi:unnamed protein product [Prunus brigantina]